ncbi:hypothetical protein [Acetivibrio straminisolvens]|uniref:hypothetical protein n=1 Tax=Acetivibrio straminisolvens TaxID=253314 RepID=UPI00104029A6|nr:hypothetical protein [Acetivibrio straminisolvens]
MQTITKMGFDDLDLEKATNKQKGNYGEYLADDNLINNPKLKEAGYDLERIGGKVPASPDDKITKGIDGIYINKNPNSNIKYVIDEAKFGKAGLSTKTRDGKQMSDSWLMGSRSRDNRILKALNNNEELADDILEALANNQVERILSKVDINGEVTTYRLDSEGNIIGLWP